MTVITHTFEEGSDGTTVPSGANGVDQIVGAPTYEADAAFHGAMGVQLSGAGQTIRYTCTPDNSGSIYTSPQADPGSAYSIALSWGEPVSNVASAHVRFHSDNTINITNPSNTNIGAASTTTWAPGDLFRFDWNYDQSGTGPYTATLTLRIFKGTNIEGDSGYEELIRSIPSYTSSTTRFRLRNNTAGWTTRFDTLRLYDTLEWPTPFNPPPPPPEFAFWEWTGTEWVGPLVAQEWIP